MENRDIAFDLLLELADFTLDQDLPKTSMRIEAAMDAFLEETGRAQRAANGAGPLRKSRPRRPAQRVLPAR